MTILCSAAGSAPPKSTPKRATCCFEGVGFFFLIEVAFKSSEPTFVGPGGGRVSCGGAGVELCGDGDSQEVHVQ